MSPAEVNRLWRNAAQYTYEELHERLNSVRRMKKHELQAAAVAIGLQHTQGYPVTRLRSLILGCILRAKELAVQDTLKQVVRKYAEDTSISIDELFEYHQSIDPVKDGLDPA